MTSNSLEFTVFQADQLSHFYVMYVRMMPKFLLKLLSDRIGWLSVVTFYDSSNSARESMLKAAVFLRFGWEVLSRGGCGFREIPGPSPYTPPVVQVEGSVLYQAESHIPQRRFDLDCK